MNNHYANLSLLFEVMFGILLLYPIPIGEALNTRSIASPHFFVPGMVFFGILFFYDEVRKMYVR